MGIGAGIFFLALGAILKFATNLHVSGIEIDTIGVILMLVGLVWSGLSLWLFYGRRRGTVVTRRQRITDPSMVPGPSAPSQVPSQSVVEERRTYDEPPETDPY